MNIFKYLKTLRGTKKIEEELLRERRLLQIEKTMYELEKNQIHTPGFIVISGNSFVSSNEPIQQSIHDNDYDFATEHHRKFHEWEMQRVNDYISKLEAQF